MKYLIRIPGKTFCFGEYAALIGGPALLMTTSPGFEMSFNEAASTQSNPFHLRSPAGCYFDQHGEIFSGWKLEFKDFYDGRGGFGASTAQFLGLALFRRYLQTQSTTSRDMDFLSNEYDQINLQLNPDLPKTQLPSGYDLRAQSMGGAVLIRKVNDLIKSQVTSWPFIDMSYLIVPTGFKIATHTHLEELKTKPLKELSQSSEAISQAWLAKDPVDFIRKLEVWNTHLGSLGLIHPRTLDLISTLRKHPEALYIKGCGALGADVLFLVFMRRDQEKIRSILSEMKLNEAYDQHALWDQEVKVQVI